MVNEEGKNVCCFQRGNKSLPGKYYETIKLSCTFNYATWFDYKWDNFLLHLTPTTKFYEFFICKMNTIVYLKLLG